MAMRDGILVCNLKCTKSGGLDARRRSRAGPKLDEAARWSDLARASRRDERGADVKGGVVDAESSQSVSF